MEKTKKVVSEIAGILVILALIQLARFGIQSLIFLFAERTKFTDRVASLFTMTLLSVLIVLAARRRKIPLSVFPKRFGKVYLAVTVAAAALFFLTPVMTRDYSIKSIVLLFYGSVVTPVFEELIFRSLVWNRLNQLFHREWVTYAVNCVLFALWHYGYADSLAFHAGTANLANILFWKAVTGLCFGLVLGALRLKTKNSYSTMLLHGVMNIFGR